MPVTTPPDLQLFGPPALLHAGRHHAWRAEQRFRLLAFLAVEARPVGRDELACLFWPDEPTDAARRNLRKTLFRLRQWLAERQVPWPADGPQLHWPWASDVQRLHQAAAARDAWGATQACTGPLLQGLDGGGSGFQDWLDRERERCQRQWRGLVLQRLDSHPAQEPALAWTERLVAADPLDEPAMQARVRALSRNGQVGAARLCHSQWRQRMHNELGLATEDDFNHLIGAWPAPPGATALHTPSAPAADPGRAGTSHAPHYLNAFVGRQAELARLHQWLAGSQRLITVLGTPGCGKTRLVSELFQQLRQQPGASRLAFVELDKLPPGPAAHSGHAEIVALLARAVGLALAGDAPSLAHLAAFIAEQPTLLLLDNFEHRLGDQPVLARLLQVPGLRLMVTSRVRLALDADAELLLGGLPVDPGLIEAESADALRLFEARCRPVTGDERDHALALCRLLQGQPLAIELAARSCRAVAPADLAQRVAADLDSLATRALDLPPRQRSLRAAFDTHWQILPAPLRSALHRLSVLRADFSAATARAVAQLHDADLAGLIDHSLLRSTDPGARLRWHPFVREFAFEHLQQDAALALAMRRAHVAHFCGQLQRLGADETRPSSAALRYLAAEAENLAEAWRHALALGDVAAQRVLAEALTLHHEFQARCGEGAALLNGASDAHVALLQAPLVHWAAPLQAEAIAEAAHQALLDADDAPGLIAAARVRGLVAWRRGAPALAAQHFRDGLALGQRSGHDRHRAILLDGLGLALHDLGDAIGARQAFGEALALNDALGNDLQAVQNLINLSLDARASAPAQAEALARRALALCAEIGFVHYLPHAQVAWSLALSADGQADAALQAVDTALAATRQSGDTYAECWAGVALAEACRVAGDATGAKRATRNALALAWRLGDANLMSQHLAQAGLFGDPATPLAQRVHEALGRLD